MAAFDSTLSDPYISSLLSASSTFRKQQSALHMSSSKAAAEPGSGQGPNLIQFLESVPPPITLLLVNLAPVISQLRWAAEVLSWKSHWTDPWLTLAAWWALCLSANAILRYLVPLTLLLPALLPYLPLRRVRTLQALPPTTERSITTSLADITTLQTLIPTLPTVPHVPLATALRISSILYVPYILTTYFVPMPITLGIAGTAVITYRAPWACTLRDVLGRSAYVQRFLLHVWSILSGSDAKLVGSLDDSTQVSSSTTSQFEHSQNTTASASPPARFIFTILECQRWWMGLDWTAALLPGERPSWCGLSHQPVPPPSAFILPPPTSVFLAAPNGTRVRRTATWRWEDWEWGILINKDGSGVKRIERKPPGVDEEEGGARIATRAASMLKERSASIGSTSEVTAGKDDRDLGTGVSSGAGIEQELGEELPTDTDGWIYGDNKWEAASAKGGMGKYTRYRRWTRIAVLKESVEHVGPGELGVIKDIADHVKSAAETKPEEKALLGRKEESTTAVPDSPKQEHHLPEGHGDGEERRWHGEERESALRERLKIAVKGVRSAS